MALDPITAIAGVADKVLGAILPDKAAKDAAQVELVKMQLSGELQQLAGQLQVNQVEAANPSVFVAGWRPAVGWICAGALFSDLIVRPFFTWGVALWGKSVVYPALDMSTLLTLLMGMLGLGAMRSYDKAQGAGKGLQ